MARPILDEMATSSSGVIWLFCWKEWVEKPDKKEEGRGEGLSFLAAKGLNTAHKYQPAEQMEREGEQVEQQEM